MALSIFEKKASVPGEAEITEVLGATGGLWEELKQFTLENAPDAFPEWNYSGKSFGWNLRIKNPKRVIIYLTPCSGSFKIAFVFGPAATEEIMRSNISDRLKEMVDTAKVYAEGRGVRIDVADSSDISDLKKMILIKLGIRNTSR